MKQKVDWNLPMEPSPFWQAATVATIRACLAMNPAWLTAAVTGDSLPPLHLAARDSDPSVVVELLQAGAPVDGRDGDGFTALFYAIKYNDEIETVRVLIDAGADSDLLQGKEEEGWKPAIPTSPSGPCIPWGSVNRVS